MNIDLRAEVLCTDGRAGGCTRVIVNPTALRLTHLVIQESEAPHSERLVPLDRVIRTNTAGIKLDCTRRELSLMDEFVELTHMSVKLPDYPNSAQLLLVGEEIPEQTVTVMQAEENIPPDEVAIDSHTRVKATDGQVGQVDELEVEPESGRIAWLVMREGHLWGQKGVAIPAAEIERVESQAVYLKLNKHEIGELPVVPVGQ